MSSWSGGCTSTCPGSSSHLVPAGFALELLAAGRRAAGSHQRWHPALAVRAGLCLRGSAMVRLSCTSWRRPRLCFGTRGLWSLHPGPRCTLPGEPMPSSPLDRLRGAVLCHGQRVHLLHPQPWCKGEEQNEPRCRSLIKFSVILLLFYCVFSRAGCLSPKCCSLSSSRSGRL